MSWPLSMTSIIPWPISRGVGKRTSTRVASAPTRGLDWLSITATVSLLINSSPISMNTGSGEERFHPRSVELFPRPLALSSPWLASTFEDMFSMILQKLRMRTQFGIYRKQNFTIRVEESFDRIRDKLLHHENLIVVRQRKKPSIEHPSNGCCEKAQCRSGLSRDRCDHCLLGECEQLRLQGDRLR